MRMTEKEYVEFVLSKLNRQSDYLWKEEIEKELEIKSRRFPIERLFITYAAQNVIDFLGHLRQVSVYLHSPIKVPQNALNWAKNHKDRFEFNIDIETSSVSAKPYVLQDIEDLSHKYALSKKRRHISSIADGMLYNLFGFEEYISVQQKMMIHTLKNMKQGSTLLACLPTGSGKSLLWQYAVATGKFSGTVIVIVPTNALATDHVKNDVEIFKRTPWIKSVNYSSDVYGRDEGKLKNLCSQIKDKEQLILYISPEGLTNAEIKTAIIEAAEKRTLSAIVIDEAHLVVDWGMKFRPEFQFLPGLIRQVKDKSCNNIYTVLLSATYTEHDRDVLIELFGDEVVYEYRGDELRPEISYYRHHCKSEEERRKLLLRLVSVVPKPVIIYVGTVANSEIYEKLIKESGFSRIARFNGETSESERERLISKWRSNQIDIMVATSAFGMGVDKSDVRTVITAYTPENISRYYQEVGRSGRDGYASLNFVLFCPSVDRDVVNNNVDKKVISTENLWKRWSALQEKAEVSKLAGESDCYILDTDTKHEGLTYEITGGYNSGWNDNVISMLARAGYISILDVWRKGTKDNHKAYYIKIRIKDFNICFHEEQYLEKIKEFREHERTVLVEGKESVRQLLMSDDWGCYANAFKAEFSYPERLCGGCPVCRKNDIEEYYSPSKQYFLSNEVIDYKKKFHYRNLISVCTDVKSISMIGYDRSLSLEEKNTLVQKLIIAEANILVFKDCSDLKIGNFNLLENNEILLLTIEELRSVPDAFICGTIVYFLDDDIEANNRMIRYSKRCIKRHKNINQIFVANVDFYNDEEKRLLVDCVEDVKIVTTILGEESIC